MLATRCLVGSSLNISGTSSAATVELFGARLRSWALGSPIAHNSFTCVGWVLGSPITRAGRSCRR